MSPAWQLGSALQGLRRTLTMDYKNYNYVKIPYPMISLQLMRTFV